MRTSSRARDKGKLIDNWLFGTFVTGKYCSENKREMVAFNIYMRRDADMQEKPGIHEPTPAIMFVAKVDPKGTSPEIVAKLDLYCDKWQTKSQSIQELRKDCQHHFDRLTARDFQKIILVSVGTEDGHYHTNTELSFAYAACEKAGDIYRMDGGSLTRDKTTICGDCGDGVKELPYTDEVYHQLEAIDKKIHELGAALQKVVADPERLKLAATTQLFLT